MATLEEACRVKNIGDEPFIDYFLGKETIIAPGQEAGWVRREAAILWFGDPSAIDHVEGMDNHDDRTKECNRLDARYGIFPIRRDEAQTTPPRTRQDAWPKVKVMTMDGEEVRMVIHDPEGVDVTPATPDTVEERRDMIATIDDLKKRVERYEEKLATAAEPPAEGELAKDEPSVGRSRGRAS
jgi:hypothetical protein